MTSLKSFVFTVASVWVGCSAAENGVPNSNGDDDTGGSSGVGGVAGASGSLGAGGAAPSGGVTGVGGNVSTGGTPSTGGTATGGTPSTGGTATGGTPSTGGTATGGTPSTGGTATGGTPSTGGTATGGTPATGGTATGGTATGGTTSTGGTATGGTATGGMGGAAAGAGAGGKSGSGGRASGGAGAGGRASGGAGAGGRASGGAGAGGRASGGAGAGGKASGGAGSGGGPSCSTTPLSGGTQHCSSNAQGNLSGGYQWTIWSSGTGGCMTPYGVGAAFKANWNNSGDFLARVGLSLGSNRKFDQFGTISADYSHTKTGTAGGYSYIGIYGWSLNPLHEYYIIDDWYGSRPSFAGDKVGSVTVDGASYDILTHTQVNQPAITGRNETFVQFWSLRTTARQCGHISISEHFRAWANAGLTLGNMVEVKILAEAGGGVGSIDFTRATVTAQ